MSIADDMTHQERKDHPVYSGVLKYFPNALLEVARVSKKGNEQHHPGEPLHWDMSKSQDEGDALVRHQIDAGKRDKDGERHSAKVAWRALAQLEREILAERNNALYIRPNGVEVARVDASDLRTYPSDGYEAQRTKDMARCKLIDKIINKWPKDIDMRRERDDLKSEWVGQKKDMFGAGYYPKDTDDEDRKTGCGNCYPRDAIDAG